MSYKIIFDPNPNQQITEKLYAGLAENTNKKIGLDPIIHFAYLVKDAEGNIKGGCQGVACYGSLHVDTLWIDEGLRNQGYGTQLMKLALEFGREKQCTFATVNTMSWEALDFYKKLGFEVEFKREGFQKNAVFYFLRQALN